SDQHRGWFQSSLIESVGTRGRAPFKAVSTHGFTLDEQGRKMSKSLGNTVEPAQVMKQYGADILRLWVASTNYTEDQRVGPDILKAVAENYRKLRNTIRYILANLKDWREDERVAPDQMPELERWVLHQLHVLDGEVRGAYGAYDFNGVFTALSAFANADLSAFYFDIRKDALYCDPPTSLRRRAVRTVLDELFNALTAWLSPILCFTMEEAWATRHGAEAASVHLRQFPTIPDNWSNPELNARWKRIRDLRRVVTGALELARAEKRIGSSLEAAPVLYVEDPADLTLFQSVDFAELVITSGGKVMTGAGPDTAFRLADVKGVSAMFERATGQRCERCWRVLPEVGTLSGASDICHRCHDAVKGHE
ncbi:MAG TPA: isoleucine--tRNA ligase, partial [Alphaproteobacteria bacterium]|nr:isoleucine--tRNA ligase [Alphaproteobacteria bacterium]